jgi:hypothetical protein
MLCNKKLKMETDNQSDKMSDNQSESENKYKLTIFDVFNDDLLWILLRDLLIQPECQVRFGTLRLVCKKFRDALEDAKRWSRFFNNWNFSEYDSLWVFLPIYRHFN